MIDFVGVHLSVGFVDAYSVMSAVKCHIFKKYFDKVPACWPVVIGQVFFS